MNDRRRRNEEQGFTVIELLIVVAIIGILAAIAIPQFQRALLKARIARIASDSKTLYTAFTRYNVDNNYYPSTSSPADRALNTTTLDPLVRDGYLRGAGPIVSKLVGGKLAGYDSPNVGGPDTEFWAILVGNGLSGLELVVGNTTQFPGFVGTHIDGSFFIIGTELVAVDEDIVSMLQ